MFDLFTLEVGLRLPSNSRRTTGMLMPKSKFNATELGLSLTTVDYSSMLAAMFKSVRLPETIRNISESELAIVQHWCLGLANSSITTGRQCSLCLSLSAITVMYLVSKSLFTFLYLLSNSYIFYGLKSCLHRITILGLFTAGILLPVNLAELNDK